MISKSGLLERILDVDIVVFADHEGQRYIINHDWTGDELLKGRDLQVVLRAMMDSSWTAELMTIGGLLELQDRYENCTDDYVHRANMYFGYDKDRIELIEPITLEDIECNLENYAKVLGIGGDKK